MEFVELLYKRNITLEVVLLDWISLLLWWSSPRAFDRITQVTILSPTALPLVCEPTFITEAFTATWIKHMPVIFPQHDDTPENYWAAIFETFDNVRKSKAKSRTNFTALSVAIKKINKVTQMSKKIFLNFLLYYNLVYLALDMRSTEAYCCHAVEVTMDQCFDMMSLLL